MVSLTGRMNNATTLSFRCSVKREYVAGLMHHFFSYHETLIMLS